MVCATESDAGGGAAGGGAARSPRPASSVASDLAPAISVSNISTSIQYCPAVVPIGTTWPHAAARRRRRAVAAAGSSYYYSAVPAVRQRRLVAAAGSKERL
eukprot:SAG31_NODE_2824_length_5038_cov_3.060336_4_plen_100_part_01